MNFFTSLNNETKPPQPKIIKNIKTIGFPCYNPKTLLLKPFIVNFVDMNCLIHFHHHQMLKLEPIPNQSSFHIVNPYIFPKPEQEKNPLCIPIITSWPIKLPKNTLLCFMHFISISDAATFLKHGK
jgi:hypothetical protein